MTVNTCKSCQAVCLDAGCRHRHDTVDAAELPAIEELDEFSVRLGCLQ